MRKGFPVLASLATAVLAVVLLAAPAPSPQAAKDEAKTPAGAAPAKKPATHKLEKGPFKIDVTLRGTFEAEEMTEVVLRPEAWPSLTVLKAVPHGTAVKKGDSLITLDLTKIDEAIRELELARPLSDNAFRAAKEDLDTLEKTTPLDLAAAERAKKQADEDYKRYTEVDRALGEAQANHSLKNTQNYLEYAQEELEQLEKMYGANDLRESTEEIVLRRQRNSVENATFAVKLAEREHDRFFKVTQPRRDVTMSEGVKRATIAWDRAKDALPLALRQKQLDFDKMRHERERAHERLAKYHKDREMMLVKSPADGVVYYGRCTRGQWTTASSVEQQFSMGMAPPNQVLLTVVNPVQLSVRAMVEEKERQFIKPNLQGKGTVTAFPDKKFKALIDSVGVAPVSGGSFEVKLILPKSADVEGLMPGMSCSVKLTAYQKDDAVTAPVTAVFAEESDEDQRYVYVAVKDGAPRKQPVKVGKTSGAKIEILEGVSAGDEILLDKPEAKKPG
jgi:multidrug resistance efflux pump